MKSFFYNLCFGVLDGYESRGVSEEWLLFKDQNHSRKDKHDLPDDWKSDIYLANPANPDWQAYLADRNDDVYACFDFDGYQIDQLGNRGTLYDYYGNKINLTSGYASFIQAMKQRHPEKRLVMNAVSEYGAQEIGKTGKTDCFYNEVWGCHSNNALTNTEARFSNLKNIIQNNRSYNAALQTVSQPALRQVSTLPHPEPGDFSSFLFTACRPWLWSGRGCGNYLISCQDSVDLGAFRHGADGAFFRGDEIGRRIGEA